MAFTVHAPAGWRKLQKLIERNADRPDFTPRYEAACNGKRVELPPATVVREDEDGGYFVCGPHEEHYEHCPDCQAGPQRP